MDLPINFTFDSNKFEILNTLHKNLGMEIEERRNQTTRLTIYFSSITMALLGILIQSEKSFLFTNKILMSMGVLVISSIMILITESLKSSFEELALVQKKIEIIWGLHESNTFLKNEKLMPDKWLDYGKKNWKEPVFANAVRVALLIAVFAWIVIWLK